MIIPTTFLGSVLCAAVSALLLVGIVDLPFNVAAEPHHDAFSELRPGDNVEATSQIDRSRKGDRLQARPVAQAVNTTMIPRVVFAPTPALPDIDDREHVPLREPAPLADCVGLSGPTMGRDISSCFV